MAVLLNGREYSDSIISSLQKKTALLKKKNIHPYLAIILIGVNEASEIYVSKKIKAAEKAGIKAMLFNLNSAVSEQKVLDLIRFLNSDDKVHGIIIQLPIPNHLDKLKILNSVLPEKDVDGFTAHNLGQLSQGIENLAAATPKGCIKLLEKFKVNFKGKHAVIINDSIIVGKPLSLLLLNRNSTVTVCHKHTKNLSKITKQADLLFSAVGIANFIKPSMVKKGFVGVDIGIARLKDKIVGDFDFKKLEKKASLITPVPNGVGPMTVAMLLENTVLAAEKFSEKK